MKGDGRGRFGFLKGLIFESPAWIIDAIGGRPESDIITGDERLTLANDAILTDNYRKEGLSFAYLSAICAIAGYTCQRGPTPDLDSIDAVVRAGGYGRPQIDVQLKSTSAPTLIGGDLHFRLRQKNYNDLAGRQQNPRILAILELPEDPAEWLSHNAERLILRRRLWWVSLERESPIQAGSRTVVAPGTQLLTPDSMRAIVADARERLRAARNP